MVQTWICKVYMLHPFLCKAFHIHMHYCSLLFLTLYMIGLPIKWHYSQWYCMHHTLSHPWSFFVHIYLACLILYCIHCIISLLYILFAYTVKLALAICILCSVLHVGSFSRWKEGKIPKHKTGVNASMHDPIESYNITPYYGPATNKNVCDSVKDAKFLAMN